MEGYADTTRKVRILMADDDEDDILLVTDALDELSTPHEFTAVHDGQELMDYLENKVKDGGPIYSVQPDLILLDINMPVMNGIEALKQIKGNPELRSIPVVVFTTSEEEDHICRCYNLGANSFLVKPKSYESLLQAMNSLVAYWFGTMALPCQSKRGLKCEGCPPPGYAVAS